MPSRRKVVGTLVVAAAVSGWGWVEFGQRPADGLGRSRVPVPSASVEEREQDAASERTPGPSAVRPRVIVRAPTTDEEAVLMRPLRELVESDPSEAIALAREGERRFPESQRAPERQWAIVKALENLKRFHEAREVARAMVDKYPGDPWAADVERHVLVYPLDQPSREEMQRRMAKGED